MLEEGVQVQAEPGRGGAQGRGREGGGLVCKGQWGRSGRPAGGHVTRVPRAMQGTEVSLLRRRGPQAWSPSNEAATGGAETGWGAGRRRGPRCGPQEGEGRVVLSAQVRRAGVSSPTAEGGGRGSGGSGGGRGKGPDTSCRRGETVWKLKGPMGSGM